MDRPANLPDYTTPPLNEVVLGVQFNPCPDYRQTFSADVWGLYKDEFPNIQEQPVIEPNFETFGGSSSPSPSASFRFNFGPPPLHGRLWFISEDQSHLIQFQDDRLLLNWRSVNNQGNYPRFDVIAPRFEVYFENLCTYFSNKFQFTLEINQSEVTYINIIPLKSFNEVDEWLSLFKLKSIDTENLNLNISEVINNKDGNPQARLIHEVQTVTSNDRKSYALRLSLTFRGLPEGNDLSAAMNFFSLARETIVNRFTEMTTRFAHESWGRKK